MSYSFFPALTALAITATCWAFACKEPLNPCVQALRSRDEVLSKRADSLILRRREMALLPYRTALEQLRDTEKQLFREVEHCNFGKDLQAWNYWHRGRLKFPGKIEQELQRLQHDSAEIKKGSQDEKRPQPQ